MERGRKTRVDIAQCSLITRAAEVQEPDMSNPWTLEEGQWGHMAQRGERYNIEPTGD